METTGRKLTKEKLAYLAGYVDADGCVRYCKGSPQISVVSVFTGVLKDMHDFFGGWMGKTTSKTRPVWRWVACGNNAMNAMNALAPYLFEKRAQVDMIVRLRETKPGPVREGLEAQLKAFKNLHYPNPNSN